MRFETNDIVIEAGLVDGGGGPAILIYPNPILRNVRAVWQGAPADCKSSGRGLRIDFAQAPQLEQRLEQVGKPPADDDTSERVTSLFFAAQKAYLAGNLNIDATHTEADNDRN